MELVLSILFIFVVPLLLKWSERFAFVKFFSPVALAYVIGIAFSWFSVRLNASLIKETTEVSIAISIVLLILASDFKRILYFLKPVAKAFGLGLISLFLSLTLVWFFNHHSLQQLPEIMGMLTGVYVGGTPNMNAIGLAVGVPSDTILLVNTAEIVFGGFYFLLLITVVKPLLLLFLKPYTRSLHQFDQFEEKETMETQNIAIHVGRNVFLGVLILGLSFVLTSIFIETMNVAFFLIALTSISIGFAQLKWVRKTKVKFETADFFLIVFSLGIGWQVDMEQLFTEGAEIYSIVAMVFFGTILLHFILAKLFGIDADTLMISSTAALYGPPFIAPVAKAIHNRELILYGIAMGLLGYVLGNYLGLSVYQVLYWISQ